MLFLTAILGPGAVLGLWLGLRAARPGRARRAALIAWAATTLWGVAVWTFLYLRVPQEDLGPFPGELLEAVPRIVAVAAVNALLPFAAGLLWARRRRGA